MTATTTCAPGTHFHTPGPGGRYRCVWCGQTPVPPPPKPRCQACCGTGIGSLTWVGPRGHDWLNNTCTACDGTGTP